MYKKSNWSCFKKLKKVTFIKIDVLEKRPLTFPSEFDIKSMIVFTINPREQIFTFVPVSFFQDLKKVMKNST